MATKFDKRLEEFDKKADDRYTALSDNMKTWKQDLEQRVKTNEDLLAARQTKIDEFQKAIDFNETTAKQVDVVTKGYTTRFAAAENANKSTNAAVKALDRKSSSQINALELQMRERNIRIQGIVLAEGEQPKAAVVRVFIKVVPELTVDQVEYAYKIPAKTETGKDPKPPIILARFITKPIRNAVFFKAKSKKEKDKLEGTVIVREDFTKQDLNMYNLAKPQMAAAY